MTLFGNNARPQGERHFSLMSQFRAAAVLCVKVNLTVNACFGSKAEKLRQSKCFRSTPNTGHRLWRSIRGLPNKYRRPAGSAYARQRRQG